MSADTTFGTSPLFVTNEDLHLTDIASDTGGSGMKSVAYSYCTDDGAGGCADAFTPIGTSTTAAGNWAVTWAAPLPADGTYRIVAVPTDNANNAGDPSSATLITVDSDRGDGERTERERRRDVRNEPDVRERRDGEPH